MRKPVIVTTALALVPTAFSTLPAAPPSPASLIRSETNTTTYRRSSTTGGTSALFEIAPAGTYDELLATLANWKAKDAEGTTSAHSEADWLTSALQELRNAAQSAREEGAAEVGARILTFAESVLQAIASYPVSEPVLAHDDNGGVEIYLQEGQAAILIAVRSDEMIQVFGDLSKEQWRAHYSVGANAWHRHFASFLDDLSAHS